jgi:deoxyribonuclease V
LGKNSAGSAFSVETAHKTQLKMSDRIVFEDRLPEKIRSVAGVDVAYTDGISIGAVAVLDYDSLELIESQTARCTTRFPYLPTLLSFREIPPAVLSIRKLHAKPDVFLVDGQGYAHPYRCGFASHLGLALRRPTIGIAKSRLFGHVEKEEEESDLSFLRHKDKIIGAALRTKAESKPIYISVGHMISLETATSIARHCIRGRRLPEPIRKAHEIASREKRKININ